MLVFKMSKDAIQSLPSSMISNSKSLIFDFTRNRNIQIFLLQNNLTLKLLLDNNMELNLSFLHQIFLPPLNNKKEITIKKNTQSCQPTKVWHHTEHIMPVAITQWERL